MRKILHVLLAFTLLFFLAPLTMEAQERTLSGTILADDSKSPLPGVTIRVKGTRRLTQTDVNGKFTIRVSTGEVLQISSVGYETADIKVGAAENIGLSLKTADNTLGEVVVTAMDIKRNQDPWDILHKP